MAPTFLTSQFEIVRLEQLLLDKLGIQEIEVIIGGSMGGMIALEFCLMDSRVKSACLMAMGKSHSAWAIGISQAQRNAIKADTKWNGGNYSEDTPLSMDWPLLEVWP